VRGDVKDDINISTALYVPNGEDCILPEVFTNDLDGLL
jgi:hypothetical protein